MISVLSLPLIVLLFYLKLTGKKTQGKYANFVTSQNPSCYTNEHDILTLPRTQFLLESLHTCLLALLTYLLIH